MTWSLLFFTTNIFLGIGLAMDAFSVSMANGLNEPHMNKGRVCTIAGVFGGFQALMPLIGWFCVHTIAEYFHVFEKFIPWIALILLLFIGGKMLIEGIKNDCEEEVSAVSPGALFVQGIATSIDALSVGFTIAEYNWIIGSCCFPDHCLSLPFYLHWWINYREKIWNKIIQQSADSRWNHPDCHRN